jgi:hypothetical protein
MAAYSDDQAAGDVAEIVFDSLATPDPHCLLCQRADEWGLWERWGGDPFAPGGDDGEWVR